MFHALLQYASEGVYEAELLAAKDIFFSKLGRSHEMKQDLYEAVSQSFLEWYLFDYKTKQFSKSPAVIYTTLNAGTPLEQEILKRSLYDHWSIYEVAAIETSRLILKDLLFHKNRAVVFDSESQLWKVEKGQLIQARLFHLSEDGLHFFSHMWLHPQAEGALLKRLCERESKKWGLHRDFLISCFETAIRTIGVEGQLKISRSHNWMYQELMKRYA